MDLICTGYIGAVLVYMLLHLRVFKACTLCVGLNIAVPEQDLTALKGAAWLASHIICQAYKGTLLLQYLYRYVLLLIIRGVMLKREEKNVCRYIYAPYTHTWIKNLTDLFYLPLRKRQSRRCRFFYPFLPYSMPCQSTLVRQLPTLYLLLVPFC